MRPESAGFWDLGDEDRGRVEGASIAEVCAQQVGPDREFAHAGPRRQRGEIVDPLARAVMFGFHRGRSKLGEGVRLDPHVGVGEASRTQPRLLEHAQAGGDPPVPAGDPAEALAGGPLPAGVAELGRQRPSMLEALAAIGQPATGEVGLGEPGFRPGFEGDPLGLARERERALERFAGIVELLAQEMGATHERERERSLLAAAGALCQLDRTPQVAERPLVGARVGGRQAEHRLDPGSLLVGVGQRAGALQALGAAGVARLQDVDVRKLPVGRSGEVTEPVLLSEPGGTRQRVRVLLVTAAGRVDQRRAEGEPGLRLEPVRAACFRLGRRASERANARVEAARVDRRAPRLQARTGGVLSGGTSSGDGSRRPRLRGAKDRGAGSLPCSARKSSTQAETCRFAASRSPASE
jgi:hypothetical protein